jgi:hypothetical protein
MSNPLCRVTTRVAYGASQLPRIAWYVGHSLAVRRLSEAAQRRDGKKVNSVIVLFRFLRPALAKYHSILSKCDRTHATKRLKTENI